MALFTVENDFTVAATAICALLLIRFFQLGFHRQFLWIVSFQFLQLLPTAAAAVLSTDSALYTRIFEYACLPSLIATLFVDHELMAHLYAKYPGLHVFNRRSVRLGFVMALVLAIPSAYSTHARWHDPEFTCMLWVWMEAMRITETGVIVYILNLLWTSKKQNVPATRNHEWMDVATGGWANRCLPLRIANEAGWFIPNDLDFEVEWDGDPGMKSLHFNFSGRPTGMAPFNMVGYGILSWVPPYLFRTPAGINLLVRGPANMPKDGITALEGVVEPDWLPYTFTINWKITRPGIKIRFAEGEPICFLVPSRRFDTERLQPVLQNISSDQELQRQYTAWHERRLRAKAISGEDGAHGSLAISDQGQYIRGETIRSIRIAEHQTKLQVKVPAEIEPPIATAHDKVIGTEPPEMHRLLKAFNGTVQLTAQDVIITRRVRWWDRLFSRKPSTLQIPLKSSRDCRCRIARPSHRWRSLDLLLARRLANSPM